jgi:hypothetical protein
MAFSQTLVVSLKEQGIYEHRICYVCRRAVWGSIKDNQEAFSLHIMAPRYVACFVPFAKRHVVPCPFLTWLLGRWNLSLIEFFEDDLSHAEKINLPGLCSWMKEDVKC